MNVFFLLVVSLSNESRRVEQYDMFILLRTVVFIKVLYSYFRVVCIVFKKY
jgi:hypothetical protein